MELTKENYYSEQANMEYMGATQFKDFQKCEREALAKIMGDVKAKQTTAMLIGSYVDAYFSGELDDFKEKNPQIFKRDGTLLKDFEQANDIIQAIENDPLMMKYLGGEHQVIMTGEISGVKFKIKVDSLLPNCIVDQKIMSSINDLEWRQDGDGYWHKDVDFVQAFGYDIQGAIYREIVRQNTGKLLPFILAVATKEEGCDRVLLEIDPIFLDNALSLVKHECVRYDMIKKGIIPPTGCENCPTCRKSHVCERVLSYGMFFNKVATNE